MSSKFRMPLLFAFTAYPGAGTYFFHPSYAHHSAFDISSSRLSAPPFILTFYATAHCPSFAALVSLAIVVSTTPGLAAPVLYILYVPIYVGLDRMYRPLGALSGSSNNTIFKGEFVQAPNSSVTQFDERAFTIPASVTTRTLVTSLIYIEAGGVAIVGALDGNSNKFSFILNDIKQ
ncbi:hypothetical protein K503DRAFT_801477 [Rhizopogon vinicolor AM-OR11-026]|uniref:Uncharacterized protein n=1 Tax=Rhizopogon vinicolor AM-OR11-026 TaxID=1314800 RepID=A0A1B7MX08_9AGAM|nr:hypothetical protein K503DRAFT_801477 [Rhizopogon vinicolor AM-OR11-026]